MDLVLRLRPLPDEVGPPADPPAEGVGRLAANPDLGQEAAGEQLGERPASIRSVFARSRVAALVALGLASTTRTCGSRIRTIASALPVASRVTV